MLHCELSKPTVLPTEETMTAFPLAFRRAARDARPSTMLGCAAPTDAFRAG